jgi:hypothetical protein
MRKIRLSAYDDDDDDDEVMKIDLLQLETIKHLIDHQIVFLLLLLVRLPRTQTVILNM